MTGSNDETYRLVDFHAGPDGRCFLTYDVAGTGPWLGLSVNGRRTRFWSVDPDDDLDTVALPRPELWGMFPRGIDPVVLARQLRADGKAIVTHFLKTGAVPELAQPWERQGGPSYNSPGA